MTKATTAEDVKLARRTLSRARDVLEVVLAEAARAVVDGPPSGVEAATKALERARDTLGLIEEAEQALGVRRAPGIEKKTDT